MENLHSLLVLLSHYPTESAFLTVAGWIVLSLIVNTVLAFLPPDKLVAKCESSRAGAFLVRAVRDAGVNPEALIRMAQALIAARAARQAASLLPPGGE